MIRYLSTTQVEKAVGEALGGVLFIDEAYALVRDGKDPESDPIRIRSFRCLVCTACSMACSTACSVCMQHSVQHDVQHGASGSPLGVGLLVSHTEG